MERRKEPKTWHGGRRGREVGGILAGVYFRKVMREGGWEGKISTSLFGIKSKFDSNYKI